MLTKRSLVTTNSFLSEIFMFVYIVFFFRSVNLFLSLTIGQHIALMTSQVCLFSCLFVFMKQIFKGGKSEAGSESVS